MRNRLLLLLLLCPFLSYGQGSLADSTFTFQTVEVVANGFQRDNNSGGRSTTLSGVILETNITKSLSELLSENSLVYIKSLGQGGLATSSFRGTSSNHTQVNWNGININSPMLGNFDFSQIPSFFTDEVTLFHGGSYLKNGTGALGGSVNLNNTPRWGSDNAVRLLSEYGTNNTLTEGVMLRFSSERLISNTRLYYQQSDNDFRYLNRVSSKDPFYERRKQAAYAQGGIMQEIYYKISPRTTLSVNGWWMGNSRDLPQPIIVNKTVKEQQESYNLRMLTSLRTVSGRNEWLTTVAYLGDRMFYNKDYASGYGDKSEFNRSHSLIAKEVYRYKANDQWIVNGSLFYRYDAVQAANYSRSQVCRNTFSMQGGAEWRPSQRWTFSAEVMGEANSELIMPTFSIGGKHTLIEQLLEIKASAAYNYHYPTLNDLYWSPGGNPDLDPERGMTYDATLTWRPKIGRAALRFEATYYLMQIDNWIIWMPTDGYLWSPRNVKTVLSHGTELLGEVSMQTGKVGHRLILNYGYSPALNRTEKGTEGSSASVYNKQLPYIPKHKWNARYLVDYRNFSFSYSASYTGERFVSADESYATNAYTVHDVEAGYLFQLSDRFGLQLKGRIHNLFDAYYESTQYYPMPLRACYLSVGLTF